MKKLALVFALAVLVPSLVLAWLAVRSLKDQQFLLERQQSLLYQSTADAAARQAADTIEACGEEFSAALEQLLRNRDAGSVAADFDQTLPAQWPLAQLGFVVTLDGRILCPQPNGRADARAFLADYSRFLANRESLEVYANKQVLSLPPADASQQKEQIQASRESRDSWNLGSSKVQQRAVVPFNNAQRPDAQVENDRQQRQKDIDPGNYSRIVPSDNEFRQVIGERSRGSLARYADNKLNLLVWERSPKDPSLVFGAMLSVPRLIDRLQGVTGVLDSSLTAEACVALLDDLARPVAKSDPKFETNWKRPLVATEIGEALPHWEIGVYMVDPARLPRAASIVRLILGMLVAVLVATIGFGSWMIVADLSRQVALARKKTDFVSNVSHELKTPLTSIRMFSELLAEGRVSEPAKQREYLGIITAEAARLTRLINNVLDFSRIDRGEKHYQMQSWDLREIVRETLETLRPHLAAAGFQLELPALGEKIPIRADRDALAQVLVNLVSNAEKYCGERKEIAVELRSGASAGVEVRVLDRGLGVPRGAEQKIFEQFYRAHDSLNNGIQGTGLGLTLARQIARAHGGDLHYERRPGGGSIFTLRLPAQTNA